MPQDHESAMQCFRSGDLDGAEALLDAILAVNPADAVGLHMRGCVALRRGDALKAAGWLGSASTLAPAVPEYLSDLGVALLRLGRKTEALSCFQRAYALNPRDPLYARNTAGIYQSDWNPLAGAEWMERAAAAAPDQAENLAQLGGMYRDLGRTAEAVACLNRAVALEPENLGLRLQRAIVRLAVCYENEREASHAREIYARDLEALERRVETADAAVLARAASATTWAATFYLPYQGQDDVELQSRFGRIVCRFVQASQPEFARRPKLSPAEPPARLRIGIVSAWLKTVHSNWKMPIRGWVENLDRGRFDLYAYYLGKEEPGVDQVASEFGDRFRHCGAMGTAEVAQLIRGDELHVLLYPEIGMWPPVNYLAALRLAPVQCTSWGHPETSGLPTMDYFLSSAMMEPREAQRYYTEELVRLPRLSIHYTPPTIERRERARCDFGIAEGAVCYLCAQSLFKYLPRHDFVFAEIAKRVPGAQFIFLGDFFSAEQSRRVKRRIERQLAAAGIDPSGRILMIGTRLPIEEFHALARVCDVYLDSLDWSGCNSAMEAMQNGLPLATYPGRFMRGRHAYAFLKLMGLPRLIAGSEEEYIEVMARLGTDREFRQTIKREISSSLPRLYGDLKTVRALENFLENAVSRSREAEQPPKVKGRGALPAAWNGENSLVEHLAKGLADALADFLRKARRVALFNCPSDWESQHLMSWQGTSALLRMLHMEVQYVCFQPTSPGRRAHYVIDPDSVIIFHCGDFEHEASVTQCAAILEKFPVNDAIFLCDAGVGVTEPFLELLRRACSRKARTLACLSSKACADIVAKQVKKCRVAVISDPAFALGRQRRMCPPSIDLLCLSQSKLDSASRRMRRSHVGTAEEAIVRVDEFPVAARVALSRKGNLCIADKAPMMPAEPSDVAAYDALEPKDRLALHAAWDRTLLSMARVVITDCLDVHVSCLVLGIPNVLLAEAENGVRRFWETWTAKSPIAKCTETADEALAAAEAWALELSTSVTPPPSAATALDAVIRASLTTLSPDALRVIDEACATVEGRGVPGSFVEVGCETSGSALLIARAKSRDRKLQVFANSHINSAYVADVLDNMGRFEVVGAIDNIELIAGLTGDSLRIKEPVAFAHIGNDSPNDLTLCLERIVPMLAGGGILIIEPCSKEGDTLGEIRAFFRGIEDEFSFSLLSSGQMSVTSRIG